MPLTSLKPLLTSEDRLRYRFYPAFYREQEALLYQIYRHHIRPHNPRLTFSDWIQYAFQHTSNAALRRYERKE